MHFKQKKQKLIEPKQVLLFFQEHFYPLEAFSFTVLYFYDIQNLVSFILFLSDEFFLAALI